MWCLHKAYQFLCLVLFFLNFHANISSATSSSITQLCSQDEAAALIQFKSSFLIDNYTSYSWRYDKAGIKTYPKTDSWKEGTDCCSWDGVICDDIKGHVIGIDLSCSGLYGSFPSNSTLFHLRHLQKLNLAYNNFMSSKMSSKFGEFASLLYLNLSRSSFAGPVPSHVSHLSKLVSLDLSAGGIVHLLTLDKHTLEGLVHNLTEVRQLFLDGINMSSINPTVLMNLSSSLRALSLKDCDLQGKFPQNIFHLPSLKMLNLGYNVKLNLNLPKLNQSSHLKILDLSFMSFSKEFFDLIGNLASLEQLDVSGATCSEGELPNSIGNLISLKRLDLSYSDLSGSIPRSMGNLSQLNYLDLSLNSFSGHIPSSLTSLQQLQVLRIQENLLEGSIPDEVNSFPNLIWIDLTSNSLNGTLPSWLYTISSLKYIYLPNNLFSGHIKEFQYDSLTEIELQNNKLQGPIPSSISQLLDLAFLDLSSNYLSGIVEFGMFSKLQNLEFLSLSYNTLSLNSNGTSVDFKLPNLRYLFLSACNVTEFPQFLRDSKSMVDLDLSDNKIYGKIPEWMWDVGKDSLSYLNLSHNSLTEVGQLPWEDIEFLDLSSNLIQGNLPIPSWKTSFFHISYNRLSGEIPSLICNVSSLNILDLSHNNLSGIIPECFGDLSEGLLMLNLRGNKLHGIIPPTFTENCLLMGLNLNSNQLEGPFTRSLLSCTNLELLDLGHNKINDTFPHLLGSLPKLRVLVLRSNQLQGSIQDYKSSPSFSKIQIFDLSNNYFTGTLPVRYIKNFKTMINLTKQESATQYMGVNDYKGYNRDMGVNEYRGGHKWATGYVYWQENRYRRVIGYRASNGVELGPFYCYSIGITIKGVEIEMVKIFTMLATIDLSNNKFQGEIPEVIGKLNSLKGLNLSHNNLNGSIPTSIGSLIYLEWLDLSSNKLTGMIPKQLLDVASLSVFNVSENQLEGQIPQGKQFNTFENDSYEGNKGLCGFPVSKGCSNSEPAPSNFPEEDGSKSNIALVGK